MRLPSPWLLLLLSCGTADDPYGADRAQPPPVGTHPDGANNDEAGDTGEHAVLLYSDQCASCHGEAGQGGSGPDLRERVPQMSDASLMRVLEAGVGGMPAPVLTENQRVALFDYLRQEFGEVPDGTDPDSTNG